MQFEPKFFVVSVENIYVSKATRLQILDSRDSKCKRETNHVLDYTKMCAFKRGTSTCQVLKLLLISLTLIFVVRQWGTPDFNICRETKFGNVKIYICRKIVGDPSL